MTDTKADAPKVADTRAETKPADDTSHRGTEKVGTYKVSAPYVTLKSRTETGAEVVLGYFAGAVLPETVDLDDLARHIRKGMVEKLEGPELKANDKAQADADKADKAEAKVVDKEGLEAVKDAEADRAAAEKAAEDEAAEAKKERRTVLRASDSPRGTKTAQTG